MSRIVGAWANNDFDGAMGFATSQGKYADKAASLSGLVQAINGDETKAARLQELAQNLPAPLAREIYENGIQSFMYTQPEKIGDWVAQIKQPSIKESVMKQALENFRYYGADQEVFSKLFDQLQPTSQTPQQAQGIASGWADSDPDKALEWASKITNQENRKEGVAAAVGAWAGKDPQATAKYVTAMPAGEARDEALSRLAQSWVGMDAKAAQAWAAGLPGDEQSKVLRALVGKAQDEDPDTAPDAYLKFTSSLSADAASKKENQQVAHNVASTMAKDDPQKAITWMQNLPAGGAREQAVGGIAEAWIGFDPAAASDWINKLPTGEGRDMAASRLASTIARDTPSDAFIWATSINDPAERRKSAESVIEIWKNNGGKSAAQAALENANFTDQERTELLKKLE
jgi:hypothetical protein